VKAEDKNGKGQKYLLSAVACRRRREHMRGLDEQFRQIKKFFPN
jgi:hypothetical protein